MVKLAQIHTAGVWESLTWTQAVIIEPALLSIVSILDSVGKDQMPLHRV